QSAAACRAAPQKPPLPCVHIRSDSSRFADESPRRPLLCRAPSDTFPFDSYNKKKGSIPKDGALMSYFSRFLELTLWEGPETDDRLIPGKAEGSSCVDRRPGVAAAEVEYPVAAARTEHTDALNASGAVPVADYRLVTGQPVGERHIRRLPIVAAVVVHNP